MEVLTLMNQISTLNNRVRLLHDLLSNRSRFNPVALLDLVSYLNRLENIYKADRNTLLTSLQNCLSATSANVTSVCQPIINNQATNAFEYYGANGPGNDFFAQQNTLALQYTGLHQPCPPPDSAGRYLHRRAAVICRVGPVPIAGEAAFVSFADRPVPTVRGLLAPLGRHFGARARRAAVDEQCVNQGKDQPSSFLPIFTLDVGKSWFLPPTQRSLQRRGDLYSVSCTPTFAQPCSINYVVPPQRRRITIEHPQIQDLFTELVGVGFWSGAALAAPSLRARVGRNRARVQGTTRSIGTSNGLFHRPV